MDSEGSYGEALIALKTVSHVWRDTAALGQCDVKHDLHHINGSTALLLIGELFETIGVTETRHIFHENPLPPPPSPAPAPAASRANWPLTRLELLLCLGLSESALRLCGLGGVMSPLMR